jgi:pyrimidine operon attenuation protein/uracil phosphoribosyltransferase
VAKNLKPKTTILDAKQMARIIRRMAGEIIETDRDLSRLLLVGIRTRGVPMAEKIAAEIEAMEGQKVPVGILDITLYRDDLSTVAAQPQVKGTHLPRSLDDCIVVLCDDVLYTGRTVRAALDELIDFGRPKAVKLAVLIDRGHRELPIEAGFVGRKVQTTDNEIIEVKFQETDNAEKVLLVERVAEGQ